MVLPPSTLGTSLSYELVIPMRKTLKLCSMLPHVTVVTVCQSKAPYEHRKGDKHSRTLSTGRLKSKRATWEPASNALSALGNEGHQADTNGMAAIPPTFGRVNGTRKWVRRLKATWTRCLLNWIAGVSSRPRLENTSVLKMLWQTLNVRSSMRLS